MNYLDTLDQSQQHLRRAAFQYNSDIKHWEPGKRERHRIRRALHELLNNVDFPGYTLRTDGEAVYVKPREALTPEARKFIGTYKREIIVWLEENQT